MTNSEIDGSAVPPNGPVQILNYEHSEGRAVLIYTSEARARKALATIARQFWAEARDDDEELPARPPGDDATAIRLYFDARGEVESYSITETVLDIRLSVDESEASPRITELLW